MSRKLPTNYKSPKIKKREEINALTDTSLVADEVIVDSQNVWDLFLKYLKSYDD